ncbi:MAG: orotate phosphoribosyltransferase [Gammaproteobacteria bacterium]|nr:orotate phosphoribosyltransferase [Gammaproteobacteria bacterium]NNF62175.1 orotate phosphoribosyltransferase [Gammaproteobacteria bacterium]NNM20142.1 orotate phosphoribosyltransferase [Gammaproteobacteria bacterium]
MNGYQQQFLRLAIELGALRFGSFTLKSGRQSPYFFNAGVFSTGRAVAALGRFYAETVLATDLEFDMLFGPAYKGIPLVAVTAAALADHHDLDTAFAYNRKEAKSHGEGGAIVGAPLAGRVIILDDVITAGTAVRQAVELIRTAGAEVAAVVLALDRQERGAGPRSAVEELGAELGTPVASIASLGDLIALLGSDSHLREHLPAMEAYRQDYGV